MLLYNHKQEFIGIDDEGLRLLNYSTLDELLNVCEDVADLFANEPGYIHNFKNFGWINFLLHADSEASSAIVHANGRVFSCKLVVNKIHLCENPAQNGYNVEMSQIKAISGEEIKPHIIALKTHKNEFNAPKYEIPIATNEPSSELDYSHITPTKLTEPSVLDIPNVGLSSFDEIDDLYPNLSTKLEEPRFQETLAQPAPVVSIAVPLTTRPMIGSTHYSAQEKELLSHHKVDNKYLYDPHVASNELGLPVDLIEEFIGDFIQQSLEFKEDLFESSAKNDFNNLHILSHKLKGVAANLRIDDAFETLSIINASTDLIEIEANLKYYFEIILKLSGEESVQEETDKYNEIDDEPKTSPAITSESVEEIYSFGLKNYEDETLSVHEEEIASPEELISLMPPQESPFQKELLDLKDTLVPTSEQEKTSKEIISEELLTKLPSFHYDPQNIARELGMEKSFFDELLFDYKNDANLISKQITQAIIAFDTHTWRNSSAKLKGISDNLRLHEISEELAILSKTNDAQEAKKASARLNNYLDQL